MRALLCGWFSFEEMGATAGDLLARDVVASWLDDLGCEYDVALAPPFVGGVDWRTADPHSYTHLVFVCGPFGNGWPITDLLARFAGRRLVGVNVSMLQSLDEWNPFDLLLERDSSAAARPDLSLLAPARAVPVVGVIRVHRQAEYPDGHHDRAGALIDELVATSGVAPVQIDTRLDDNAFGSRDPASVVAAVARMDAIVTTRLHGLVLALKHGVPAVAIDPIGRSGAKVVRQAEALGWPHVYLGYDVTLDQLRPALRWCLTGEARALAAACAEQGAERLADTYRTFAKEFA